jgi:hypothetical protein
MDENFCGGLKKPFLRGCVHRHPLIFAFFLRGVRQKFLNFWGGVCVGTLIFSLRGSKLVHGGGGGGGGVYIKWNGPL